MSTSTELSRVGVVGGGLMGAGIAEVCARAGSDVVVVESSDDAVLSAVDRLQRSLARAAAKGKIESVDVVLQRIDVVTDLSALVDRELVVEAIVENEPAKVELFRRLDEIVTDPEAIL